MLGESPSPSVPRRAGRPRGLSLILGAAAVAGVAFHPPRTHQAPPNQLTGEERAAGWRLLFDGRSFRGWRGLGYDSVPTAHWVIANGADGAGAHPEYAGGKGAKLPGGPIGRGQV